MKAPSYMKLFFKLFERVLLQFRLGLTNVRSSVRLLGHWPIIVGQLFDVYIDLSCSSIST